VRASPAQGLRDGRASVRPRAARAVRPAKEELAGCGSGAGRNCSERNNRQERNRRPSWTSERRACRRPLRSSTGCKERRRSASWRAAATRLDKNVRTRARLDRHGRQGRPGPSSSSRVKTRKGRGGRRPAPGGGQYTKAESPGQAGERISQAEGNGMTPVPLRRWSRSYSPRRGAVKGQSATSDPAFFSQRLVGQPRAGVAG